MPPSCISPIIVWRFELCLILHNSRLRRHEFIFHFFRGKIHPSEDVHEIVWGRDILDSKWIWIVEAPFSFLDAGRNCLCGD